MTMQRSTDVAISNTTFQVLSCKTFRLFPLFATPPFKYRATPFGQFLSCSSTQTQPDPSPDLNPLGGLGPAGGGRLFQPRFSRKTRPAKMPASTNYILVLQEFILKVVLQLGTLR